MQRESAEPALRTNFTDVVKFRINCKEIKHSVVWALDIKKTYHMFYKPALIQKLYKPSFRGHMSNHLCRFLSKTRRIQMRSRSIYSDFYRLEDDLSQGSCLSPLLFNAFIELFHDTLKQVCYSLFTDDVVVWCTDSRFR